MGSLSPPRYLIALLREILGKFVMVITGNVLAYCGRLANSKNDCKLLLLINSKVPLLTQFMSLLQGGPKHLSWNPGAEQAMYKLKVAITTAPMLRKWTPLKQGWGPLCHNILPRGPNSILWPSYSKSWQLLNATMTYATIKLDSVPLIGTQLKTDTLTF